jgi:hypothetical protein
MARDMRLLTCHKERAKHEEGNVGEARHIGGLISTCLLLRAQVG